jgi:hypothetical protein
MNPSVMVERDYRSTTYGSGDTSEQHPLAKRLKLNSYLSRSFSMAHIDG